jgi:hypothetical protein
MFVVILLLDWVKQIWSLLSHWIGKLYRRTGTQIFGNAVLVIPKKNLLYFVIVA